MGKIFVLCLIFICICAIWALPLWAVVNFACWVFHISFHLSLLQAFALCLLANVLKSLLFNHKEGK